MATAFEESLKLVKSVEPRKDFATFVPRDGISLNFLLKHLADAKLASNKAVKSSYDLEAYVLEHTVKWHCSFTEMLKSHPTHRAAVVDNADYFVSFAYSTEFETVLSALDKFRRKRNNRGGRANNRKDLFVWNSIFSVNQHFGRKGEAKLTAPVVYPKGWFKDAFEKCIPSIGNVLFVMSPLAEPVALQRLWCIYELYLTISNDKCTLDVILSEDDEQYLIDNLLRSSQSILDYINSVNAEKATSSNPNQEDKLRQEIVKVGYAQIDDAVRDRLRKWFAHAATQYIADKKAEYKKDRPKYIDLLGMVAKMLQESGRLEEAFPLESERLAECQAYYGNEHQKTATALNNLALLLRAKGDYTEAEKLQREGLKISENVYGKEHPDYALKLNNLALLLRAKGDYAEAEKLQREGLKISEKVYGKEHPDYALKLNNLAQLLQDQGKLDEAEPLMREALRIDKKVYGDEHPDVARDLNNLAQLLEQQGKLEEAEAPMREALAIFKKVLGEEHPNVAVLLNNIAEVLRAQGNLDEVEPLYREALAIDRKVYGNEHPDVAIDLSNLALLLKAQGKYEEAKPRFEEAIAIWKKVYGDEHPQVAIGLNNLALLLWNQDKNSKEADRLGKEALRIAEKRLGKDHSKTQQYRKDWG